MKSTELTKRQLQILYFIYTYHEKWYFYPSYRDIAEFFEMTPRAVSDHIFYIRKKGSLGLLDVPHGKSQPFRSFVITEKGKREVLQCQG